MEKEQIEQAAKEVLQNNKLPTEGDFAEGFITGAQFGVELQKEQSSKLSQRVDAFLDKKLSEYESPKKEWTDEEVKSLTDYVARYSWGHYDPIATITKWWEQYKQQIK
jgi:hypothetical protein